MDQKQKIKEALKCVEFHANWDIEKTSKSFKSIKQSIEEHLQDKESFAIEVLFLESYLHMSECKGISETEKDILTAMKKNDEAFALIKQLDDGPIKDDYKLIYLAMRCWISVEDQPDISSYKNLEQLLEKYQDEVDKEKFQASICVTKALAYSKLSFSRYNESERQLVIATETCPNNAEWLFMLGLIKCRRYKIKLKKNQYSSNLKEVKRIMKTVLKLKSDHAYAMVILADIKRRKYEHNKKGDKDETQSSKANVSRYNRVSENDYDDKITSLLTRAKQNASRPKILSEVAQCYIHMGRYCTSEGNFQQTSRMRYFQEACDVIELAKDNFQIAACVIAQEAVLYREQGNTEEELKCLDDVIEMKPSNVGARIQKAQALLRTQRQCEGFAMYKNLLVQFKDPFDLFDINRNYASSLAVKKKYTEAYDKNNACLEIALGSFVNENSSEKPGEEVKFIEEEEEQVQKVIGYIKVHLNLQKERSKKSKINPTLELAKVHEKIGHYKYACSYYNEALRYLPTSGTKIYIFLKLTEVNIKLGRLSDAKKEFKKIENTEGMKEHEEKIGELQICIAVAEGERATKSGEHAKAIEQFASAAKMGSVMGAKKLFQELKKKPIQNHLDFFKNCALVKYCIKTPSDDESVLDDLHKLVHSYDDGCLMNADLQKLRASQLEMECGYLLDHEITEKIATVIHKCRSILNYAMMMFRNKHYSGSINKDRWKDNTDFFIVYCENPNEKDKIKDKIVKKITKQYGWTNFDTEFPDLLDYLVSIQPQTDPKNTWIQDLIELDNDVKHKRSLQELTKSMEIARKACFNIRRILDEFCKHLKPQPAPPSQT